MGNARQGGSRIQTCPVRQVRVRFNQILGDLRVEVLGALPVSGPPVITENEPEKLAEVTPRFAKGTGFLLVRDAELETGAEQ